MRSEARAAQDDGTSCWARISVRDEGPGIGLRAFLEHAQHDGCAGSVRKAGELFQRLLSVDPASRTADQANQRGPLGARMPAVARGSSGRLPEHHL